MTDKKSVTLDRGIGILLLDLGIQPANVLRRAELPHDLLGQDQVRVTVDDYFALWNALEAEANDDPALPIRLGKAMTAEAFHPAIFAALCSPNLTVAAQRIAQYKKLIAPITMTVEESSNSLFVLKQWDDPTLIIPASLAATELVFLAQIARIGTRERICPIKVESPHAMEPTPAYEDYFGVTPQVSKKHGVTFSLADAQRPFMTASESMWETFEPELRRRVTTLEASAPLRDRVKSVLLESLPSGEASVDIVARRLGLSPRTLQRRLKPEGTSFKEIVTRTREQLARHYVSNTNLAYAEISFLIGFGEPSSFFRAFREWTGTTPESARMAVDV
jgi:AraC-like DNA-binding protein